MPRLNQLNQETPEFAARIPQSAIESAIQRIGIVTPAPPRSRYGNRVTALRWARILRELGHRVTIVQDYSDEAFDLLVALHAKRSHDAILRFARVYPDRPRLVVLTGTDLYRDLNRGNQARASLERATRILVLQPRAFDELPVHLHEQTRVVYQSVAPFPRVPRPAANSRAFQVCVIGHLREVKDPFRAARAARRLPAGSRIQVVHAGGAMTPHMADCARREMAVNPRYRWIGDQPAWRVRQLLLRSQVCVHSSHMEGGSNVVSEAITAGTPLLASAIAGNIGLLGERYSGYFSTGATPELARLLLRAEQEPDFLSTLRLEVEARQPLFTPAQEQRAWRQLLAELDCRTGLTD
jgi:putative glycosyltransferase (TIGR04348 family)